MEDWTPPRDEMTVGELRRELSEYDADDTVYLSMAVVGGLRQVRDGDGRVYLGEMEE